MKFMTLFSAFGLVLAASAASSSFYDDSSDIISRDEWTDDIDFQRRNYLDEDSLYEREDIYDVSDLEARYFDSSYELSEREFEEVEARFAAVAVRVAVQGIKLVVEAIQGQIEKDKNMRSEWTKHMVSQFRQKYPQFNFVVVHTAHTKDFKGTQGVDWGHSHQEVKVFGGTIGFEIYWFKEGTFHRQGDGGFLNWAYAGKITGTSDGGKTVNFAAP